MPSVKDEERIIIDFLLDELETRAAYIDAELRGYIVMASNRFYDLTNKDEKES